MSNQQQMNMGTMGGPVGGQQLMNAGTPGPTVPTDYVAKLNTYIYDYFIRSEKYDLARQLAEQMTVHTKKNSEQEMRQPNGMDDGMDVDKKDAMESRPSEMLVPDSVPYHGGSPFLQDWFTQFWEMYWAHRKQPLRPINAAYMANQLVGRECRVYV